MVDEYIKNDFEGVISGGLKTKFRVILRLYSILMFLKKILASVTIKFCLEMINNSINTYLSKSWLRIKRKK